MAKRESKTKKTASGRATKRKATSKATRTRNDGRGLLLGEYKTVGDLIKRGTADDRITAAIFCNYPVGNLYVEHLTNAQLKRIVSTFTPDEWITYGFHGAVHETAYQFVQDFQKAARQFLTAGRILHTYTMAHKSAIETARLLTKLLANDANQADTIKEGAPTLYGWNVSPDGVVTPDFAKDLGNGVTFRNLIKNASSEVFKGMSNAKTLYLAFERFRDSLADQITLERIDDLFFDDVVKLNLESVMKNYALSPEYGLAYLEQYAEEKGVDMKDLPAEMLEIGYFPSWGLTTPEPLQISGMENYLFGILSENARDYARIVSDATGLNSFEMGTYTYTRETNENQGDESTETAKNE